MRNALNRRLLPRDIEQATSVACYPLVALVLLLFAGMCSAQTQFARAVGGTDEDFGLSVVQTTDGGYAVTGITGFGAGDYDLSLVKFDSTGSMEWTKAVGGSYDDQGYSVVKTTDGGYAVTGITESFGAGDYDLFLVKFDSTGSMEWAKAVGGSYDDQGYSVVQTTDGGYAVAGVTFSFGAGDCDLLLVKFSSSGSLDWAKVAGGGSYDYCYSLVHTTDGGYATAGITESFSIRDRDLFLVKFNSTGSVQWAKTVGGMSRDYGWSVIQTTDGGYAVAGMTWSFGVGCEDIFLVKFSSSGSLDWTKAVGGRNRDYSKSVVQTTDGGYVVTGYTNSFSAGNFDLFLVKLNSSGTLDWAEAVGGLNDDYGWSVIQTTDGGYAVAGMTWSFGVGNRDLFLVKFDGDGNTCIGSEAFPTVTDVSPSFDSVSPTVTTPSISISGITPTITDITLTVTVTEICTDFISEELTKPTSFELTVSPNPFNSSCAITVNIEQSRLHRDCVTVEIYDLQGRLVWNKPSDSDNVGATSLIKGGKPEEVPINNGDVAKRQGVSASAQEIIIWQPEEIISSGVYLVRATTDDGQQMTKRIVYLK